MTRGSARRSRRRIAAIGLLLSSVGAALVGLPASALDVPMATFTNSGPISIPHLGTASPYPSGITVGGLAGSISDVNVTLNNLSHTFPDDIDVLLVSPDDIKVLLMAEVGGNPDVSGVTLTLDDEAPGGLPEAAMLSSGTYRPTLGGTSAGPCCTFSGPFPPGPQGFWETLDIFDGPSPNGTWNLYVYDDNQGDSGSIAGGWTLEITTVPTIMSFTPDSGQVGDAVTITGTSFTGATAVSFDGVAATFTVDSPTQISTTVPAGAGTGPLAVTTTGGTGSSGSFFVVNHAREVSLTFSRARGTVTVLDEFNACRSNAPILLQRFVNGSWRTVDSGATRSDGSYDLGNQDPGRYRTIARKFRTVSGDRCLKDISPAARN